MIFFPARAEIPKQSENCVGESAGLADIQNIWQ